MTWGEFQIRLHGYKRKEETDWRKVRKMAFSAMIGSHLNHKKLPRDEAKWFPIGDESKIREATESHRQRYLDAMKKYIEQKKAS